MQDDERVTWDGDADEEWMEQEPCLALFRRETCDSAASALKLAKDEFGVDLVAMVKQLKLDLYGSVRLVNFVRAAVARVLPEEDGAVLDAAAVEEIKATVLTRAFLEGEEYLKPVVEGDPLLFELDVDSDEEEEEAAAVERGEAAELRERVAQLEGMLQQMSGALQRVTVGAEDDSDQEAPRDDAWYFDSYSDLSIHETMLRDRPRTTTYRDACYDNKELFAGKVVLDVGCGSGILSMFAAKAGARRVIGVDNASIIHRARRVVKDNGLDDRITLVHSRLEDIKELPDGIENVDIIISEWMGYFLLFESMLPSVLYARDRWLTPGSGVVLPNTAVMYMNLVDEDSDVTVAKSQAEDAVDEAFWSDVYGFDMRALLQDGAETQKRQAGTHITLVPEKRLVAASPVELVSFDLMTVRDAELDFETDFTFELARDGNVTGFVVYFDNDFNAPGCTTPHVLRTGPADEPTHWKQTLFHLRHPITNCAAGTTLQGHLAAKRNPKVPREYDVVLTFKHPSTGDDVVEFFRLSA